MGAEFQGLRVLVADDDQANADALSDLIRSYGCETRTVYSGDDALEILESFRPQLALLDLVMPGMHAFELARRLRERPDFGNTTIVGMTAMHVDQDLLPFRKFGFVEVLSKPIQAEELRAWVERVYSTSGPAAN